jgi:hypothetical protein
MLNLVLQLSNHGGTAERGNGGTVKFGKGKR